MKSWFFLFLAIAFEAAWVIGLRYTDGFKNLWPSILVMFFYVGGLVPITLAGKGIAPSVLYTIWVGGGIVSVSLIDIVYFHESASPLKLLFIAFILVGATGLKILSGGH